MAAVILLAASLALAQSTATLTGTVVDPTGAVVPNADVTCRNTQTGVTNGDPRVLQFALKLVF